METPAPYFVERPMTTQSTHPFFTIQLEELISALRAVLPALVASVPRDQVVHRALCEQRAVVLYDAIKVLEKWRDELESPAVKLISTP